MKKAILLLAVFAVMLFPGVSRAQSIEALPLGGAHLATAMLAAAGQVTVPAGPTFFYVVTSQDANGFQSVFPTAVSATFTQGTHIANLTWTPGVVPTGGAAIAGYNVWRGATATGPFSQINSALATVASYSDTFVLPTVISGLAAKVQ